MGRSSLPAAKGKSILSLVLCSCAVPMLMLAVLDNHALPRDFRGWLAVISAMDAGENPYQATPFLNWPPYWMIALRVLSWVSASLSCPLMALFQLLMFVTGLAVVVASFKLTCLVARDAATARKTVLWGLGANPLWWLLVLYSGNFDVFLALWHVLAITSLVAFVKRGRFSDWLSAAMWIGIGIFTKTVSFVLLPLLLLGKRSLDARRTAMAAWMLIAPTLLPLAVLMSFDPMAINQKVVNYHSVSGWFGMTGWLAMLVSPTFAERIYPGLFLLILMAVSMHLARRMALLSRRSFKPRRSGASSLATLERDHLAALVIRSAALVLLLLPTLGSGFGTHYLLWSWPLLVVVAGTGQPGDRAVFLLLVGVATTTVGYAYISNPAFGPVGFRFMEGAEPTIWLRTGSGKQFETLISTPLFLALLLMLGRLGFSRKTYGVFTWPHSSAPRRADIHRVVGALASPGLQDQTALARPSESRLGDVGARTVSRQKKGKPLHEIRRDQSRRLRRSH